MKFRDRIEIWQTIQVADGSGGSTPGADEKVAESWAHIKTMGVNSRYANIQNSEGLQSSSNGIVITVRNRRDFAYNNINQFIKFKGVDYSIKSMPVNVDFNNDYIEFVAVRDEIENVPELDPMT